MKTLIKNGNIILPDRVDYGGSVLTGDGRILKINTADESEADEVIDASGRFVMPGMIDIHSDMIESYIQPRSTALMGFFHGIYGSGARTDDVRHHHDVSFHFHV